MFCDDDAFVYSYALLIIIICIWSMIELSFRVDELIHKRRNR